MKTRTRAACLACLSTIGLTSLQACSDSGVKFEPRMIGNWTCVPTSGVEFASGVTFGIYTPDGRYSIWATILGDEGGRSAKITLVASGDWRSDGATLKESPSSFRITAAEIDGNEQGEGRRRAIENEMRSQFLEKSEWTLTWLDDNQSYEASDGEITISCGRIVEQDS